jgi:tRNA A-37 threonylcarbamoyl transferase component Bud32
MTNIFVKKGVEMHEYKMHDYVYDLHIVNIPKIISYNKTKKELVMEKITGSNLSDFYEK